MSSWSTDSNLQCISQVQVPVVILHQRKTIGSMFQNSPKVWFPKEVRLLFYAAICYRCSRIRQGVSEKRQFLLLRGNVAIVPNSETVWHSDKGLGQKRMFPVQRRHPWSQSWVSFTSVAPILCANSWVDTPAMDDCDGDLERDIA